jgi:LemA protein
MGKIEDNICGSVCVGIIIIIILFTLISFVSEKAFIQALYKYWLWLLLFPLIVVTVYVLNRFIRVYNWFKITYNAAEASLNQVRVAMKKRLDMIERLYELVRSYSEFEQETFVRVTSMRSSLKKASPAGIDEMAGESQSLFGRLLAVAENYPQLKTSDIIKDLTRSITNIETEISTNRYKYNDIVQQFNTKMDTIPTNIVGFISRFKKLQYLAFEDAINEAPRTKF